MTPRPDRLVSIAWLLIALWCVIASTALVIGLAWLIAQGVQWLGIIGAAVMGS